MAKKIVASRKKRSKANHSKKLAAFLASASTLRGAAVAAGVLGAVIVIGQVAQSKNSEDNFAVGYHASLQSASALGVDNIISLAINGHKITEGPNPIRVRLGDDIMLRFTGSEQPEADVMIEGYGQQVAIEQGSIAELKFKADKAGTFDIRIREDEDEPGTEKIGQLEVSAE